jgi:CheY-like chemotaxis protein
MADTGEDREIKARTDAKEAEVMAESKKLLQESIAATDKALSKRRRLTRKEIVTPSR